MTKTHRQNQNEPAISPRRRAAAQSGGVQLQERDICLLVDLFFFGCMLRGQIQQLFFGSVQRTNARLKQLYDAGYLKKAVLPLPSCLGTPFGCQSAYMLGPQATTVVAARTGLELEQIRRQQRHGTPTYLLHTLEIVQFRLALEAAVRAQGTVRLERFLPERACHHSYHYQYRTRRKQEQEGSWKTEVYKPDAVFILSWPEGACGFAVEIDLGHTSSKEFLTKLTIHSRYAHGGLFAKRYGVENVCTLVVTTSPTRRDHLKALLESHNSRRFWLSTFAEVIRESVLGAIWHVPFAHDPQRLQPLSPGPIDMGSVTDDAP